VIQVPVKVMIIMMVVYYSDPSPWPHSPTHVVPLR
jgi:hypothetical protein